MVNSMTDDEIDEIVIAQIDDDDTTRRQQQEVHVQRGLLTVRHQDVAKEVVAAAGDRQRGCHHPVVESLRSGPPGTVGLAPDRPRRPRGKCGV